MSASIPPSEKSRVLVVLNPAAGQSDVEETEEEIEHFLSEAGVDFEIRRTEGAGDAREMAESAAGFDQVLVAGGDGTVMEAISGMIRNPLPVPLAVLPLGTGNLLARALAIPTDLEAAMGLALHEGVVVAMDVGYLPDRDRYFAIVAGSGWDAQMIADATRDMKANMGILAYFVTGITNLFDLRSSNVQATIDGQLHRFRAHTVMVLNIGEIFGSGIALGDNVSPHDGKLDLLVASTRSPWAMMRLFLRILTKHYKDEPDLRYFSLSKLRIDSSPPLKLEIDGEYIGRMPFEVEVVPSGARLVVPREYAEAKSLDADPL